MKKIIFCLLMLNAYSIFAQDSLVPQKDTSWKIHGFLGLTASQTSLNHWQGGGQNSIALNTLFNFEANYAKDKTSWVNKIDAQYGLIKLGSSKLAVNPKLFRKNTDQLFAMSKFNLDAWNKYWFYTLVADFRSQFAPGYNYENDTISGKATSDLTSPVYIQLALGFDIKPTKYFSITMAPLAGKITHVDRQYLADEGAYGVEPAVYNDSTGALIKKGKKTRYEFGGRITLKFKKEITKNVSWDSYLDLFSNYNHNPGNIDMVFNNFIIFKVNKLFTFNINSQMIYDDDIIIKEGQQADGSYKVNGPRLQALTTLSFGFGYKF